MIGVDAGAPEAPVLPRPPPLQSFFAACSRPETLTLSTVRTGAAKLSNKLYSSNLLVCFPSALSSSPLFPPTSEILTVLGPFALGLGSHASLSILIWIC